MKPPRLMIPLTVLLLIGLPATLLAVPAYQGPVETKQPDGMSITVRIFGDEWYHFYESEDGYTIVQDRDGWWVYADLDDTGVFIATEHRVGLEDADALGFRSAVGRHLREYNEEKLNRRARFFERTMPSILESAVEMFKDGKQLTVNVPVVLIEYADYAGTESVASFTDMMNQAGYDGTGSFQDYYHEISYNHLTVTATVVGWYASVFNRSHYAWTPGSTVQWSRARGLAHDAVVEAENDGLNWAPFDNDGNGDVDVTFIVHQGPGAECGNPTYIWSHAWFLNAGGTNLSVTYDGKLIDRYVMQPELDCTGTGHVDIGVFCHEFGHALGLPDLYDVDYSSAGIGNWCLMSFGSWGGDGNSPETPAHMSAWCKIENGWITPTVVPANTFGTAIPDVETNPTVFKLWTNGLPGPQYFLVENRFQTGFDLNLFTSGLAIWHIDENMRENDNRDNENENHKLVDLEEADGLRYLDYNFNRGDPGDLFPGSSMNATFDGASNPNSNDYAGGATQVCVQNISAAASIMYADFCVGVGGTIDLVIRDCAADVGAEPDLPCDPDYIRSLDIWIDNNDDGIIDAPIKGQNNHLYIRSWNIGTGTALNANIRCWYIDPTPGLVFGMGNPGTPILDYITGLDFVTIPAMMPLAPSPGGIGYRTYFNWLIPTPPPNINHYCIGCVIEATGDTQLSPYPIHENNLGQINYLQLSRKAGSTPAKVTTARQDETIYRQQVRVYNSYEDPTAFNIVVEGLPPEWDIVPSPEVETPPLAPDEEFFIEFDIVKHNSAHRDSAAVMFQLFKLPEIEFVGGIHTDLAIDDLPPLPVGNWNAQPYRPPGDNLVRPMPTGVLSWGEPDQDTGGFPERIRFYEIYAGPDPGAVMSQDPIYLLAQTYGDDDPSTPGFQHFVYEAAGEDLWYTVVPVDMAEGRGDPVPAGMLGAVSSVPHAADDSAQLKNYPNPFNPQTTIDFTLSRIERVRVSVFDSKGRLVKVLTDELYQPGTSSVTWDGKDEAGQPMASGVYFLKLNSFTLEESRKIALVR